MINFPQPLRNRVIVSKEKPEQTTAGGIIIPNVSQEQQTKGTVIAVGPGTKKNPMFLKPGQVVCYSEDAGETIEHNDIEYLIMQDNDIFYNLK